MGDDSDIGPEIVRACVLLNLVVLTPAAFCDKAEVQAHCQELAQLQREAAIAVNNMIGVVACDDFTG